MKRLLKNLLWLPAFIASALSHLPAAVVQLRLANPSTPETGLGQQFQANKKGDS